VKRLVYLLVLVMVVSGCATLNNFSHIKFTEPSIHVYKDPDIDFTKYRKFTLIPIADKDIGKEINPIAEKQLLFIVRNTLEYGGYKYVGSQKDADFLVSINFKNDYKTVRIPPRTITIPIYNPGTSYSSFFSGSYSGYGSYGGRFSGTATTYKPGYWTSQTHTIPEKVVGYFYPTFAIYFFDKEEGILAWEATGVSITKNSDIRLTAQYFFSLMTSDFPNRYDEVYSPEWYGLGFSMLIFSTDGNDYYPTVVRLWKGSPGKIAGLRSHDIIKEINGTSTLNKTFNEIREIIKTSKDEKARLLVKRMDEEFYVEYDYYELKKE